MTKFVVNTNKDTEMFLENAKKAGCIEVICGSMFSGKTEELIRRLKRAQFAKQKIATFKPTIDTRYSELDVVSHDSHSISCTPIKSPSRMLQIEPGLHERFIARMERVKIDHFKQVFP